MALFSVYVPGGCYDYLTMSGQAHIDRLTKAGTVRDTLSHIEVNFAIVCKVALLVIKLFI